MNRAEKFEQTLIWSRLHLNFEKSNNSVDILMLYRNQYSRLINMNWQYNIITN